MDGIGHTQPGMVGHLMPLTLSSSWILAIIRERSPSYFRVFNCKRNPWSTKKIPTAKGTLYTSLARIAIRRRLRAPLHARARFLKDAILFVAAVHRKRTPRPLWNFLPKISTIRWSCYVQTTRRVYFLSDGLIVFLTFPRPSRNWHFFLFAERLVWPVAKQSSELDKASRDK